MQGGTKKRIAAFPRWRVINNFSLKKTEENWVSGQTCPSSATRSTTLTPSLSLEHSLQSSWEGESWVFKQFPSHPNLQLTSRFWPCHKNSLILTLKLNFFILCFTWFKGLITLNFWSKTSECLVCLEKNSLVNATKKLSYSRRAKT